MNGVGWESSLSKIALFPECHCLQKSCKVNETQVPLKMARNNARAVGGRHSQVRCYVISGQRWLREDGTENDSGQVYQVFTDENCEREVQFLYE